MKTNAFAAELGILDVEPARTHDLALDDEELESGSVGAKHTLESPTSEIHR